MIGVGYGCIPRGVFKGSVLTYHNGKKHFVVARYSPFYEKMCSDAKGKEAAKSALAKKKLK